MYENDEIEIDLVKILKTCWKKAWLILLTAAVLGGGMFAYGKSTHVPTYTATTTLYASYINNRDFAFGENAGSIAQNSLSESRSLVSTCVAVLNTRMTREAVIEAAGLDMNAAQLGSMVSAASVNNTELFTVSVTGTDPEQTALIANTIGQILPEHVAMVNSNSNVGVIDEALVPASDNGSSVVKNAAAMAVLGAFLVCVVIAVVCIVDDFKAAKKKNT